MRIWKGSLDDFKLLEGYCQRADEKVSKIELESILAYPEPSIEGVYLIAEDETILMACWVRYFRERGVRINRIISTLEEESPTYMLCFQQFLTIFLHKYRNQDQRMLFCFTKSDYILKVALQNGFDIYSEIMGYRKRDYIVPEFQGLPVKIRPFWEEDIDQLVDLESGIFMPEFWNSGEIFYRLARDERGVLLVAQFMGQVVGYNYNRILDTNEGHLVRIGVHQDYQGLGIGKLLLKQAIEWFSEREVSSIILKVKRENIGARALYEKFSFVLDEDEGIEYILLLNKN